MSIHKSDCAVHNEPAFPKGECDCGVGDVNAQEARSKLILQTQIYRDRLLSSDPIPLTSGMLLLNEIIGLLERDSLLEAEITTLREYVYTARKDEAHCWRGRIDQLEKELIEARKDALVEAHRILSNSQSKPEALGNINAAMEAK